MFIKVFCMFFDRKKHSHKMKKFKMNAAIAAIAVGAALAFAFTSPSAAKPNQVAWVRLGTPSNPDGNSWVQQTSGSCDDADEICKATFASGYNPNSHTYLQNQTNATITQDNGYVPQ
jgi:hypothetical protein